MPQVDDEHAVHIEAGAIELEGTLEGTSQASPGATGVVLFAHGSGSSRFSPRNQYVAKILRDDGFATLLLDLLTSAEEQIDARTRHFRFDIDLLAERLVAAIDWLGSREATRELPIGLFGASTGAGAALVAAATRPRRVRAVVSRGGRPDLAGAALARVHAPTLLIVGGRDEPVIELNEAAQQRMLVGTARPDVRIEIVAGATHLFEEPGTLEQVAVLARDWFAQHLAAAHTVGR